MGPGVLAGLNTLTSPFSKDTEDIRGVPDTIKLLELQRGKFVTAEKYLQAAEVVKQITECRGKQRKLQAELTKLQKADGRSKKYQKGKCQEIGANCG